VCDFLISRSPEQLEVEFPVVVLVEAKKADINSGMGQCMVEMVAAQQFNQQAGDESLPIYGCVSNGLLWRFLKLEQKQITVDFKDYSLEDVSDLLGKLVWMCGSE
jgi:hypothetical protein